MKKKVVGYIKLQIPAMKANPSPPIGPALSQKGLNIMEFCKQFNELSKGYDAGVPIRVLITAYADKSFEFLMKTPPTSYYIRNYAGLEKGSSLAGREIAGKIKKEQAAKIAQIKFDEMGTSNIDTAISMIIGTARSMGVEVAEE